MSGGALKMLIDKVIRLTYKRNWKHLNGEQPTEFIPLLKDNTHGLLLQISTKLIADEIQRFYNRL
jgi:hypothetical protein